MRRRKARKFLVTQDFCDCRAAFAVFSHRRCLKVGRAVASGVPQAEARSPQLLFEHPDGKLSIIIQDIYRWIIDAEASLMKVGVAVGAKAGASSQSVRNDWTRTPVRPAFR